MNEKAILIEVIEILHRVDLQKRNITENTLIFTELDFDSLQMLELTETLQERFGVNFLSDLLFFKDLRTPASIATVIAHTKQNTS